MSQEAGPLVLCLDIIRALTKVHGLALGASAGIGWQKPAGVPEHATPTHLSLKVP